MTQVLSLFELFGHCVCMRCQYEPGKLISKCYLSKNCHFMITNWRKSLNSELFRCFFGNRFEMLVYIGGSIKIDINGQWYTNKHDFTSNIFFYPYSINHISDIITTMTIQSISLPNIFRILIPSPTSSKITMQQNLTTNGQKYNYFQFLSDIRIVYLYK